MTRAATMLLALLILQIVLGSLSLAVGRGMERPLALRYWGFGLLVNASAILVALPSGLPYGYNEVFSDALAGFAAILATSALLRNTGYRYNTAAICSGYAAFVLIVAANHLRPDYSVPFDMSVPAIFPAALFLFASFALFRTPTPEAKTACRFLAGLFLFAVLAWTTRITLVLYSLGGTNDRVRADMAISFFVIVQIIIGVGATLGLLWVEVRKMEMTLRWIAGTDDVTGLPNRRATLLKFEEEAARGRRRERPYSIALFDIDHFKKINDAYGHAFGDAALKQVANVLSQAKREVDVVGRFGGEEFVAIISEEGPAGAAKAASRLHSVVRYVTGPDPKVQIPLTMSAGVASAPDDGRTWDELFAAADRRLYEAKRGGRNRVVWGTDVKKADHARAAVVSAAT